MSYIDGDYVIFCDKYRLINPYRAHDGMWDTTKVYKPVKCDQGFIFLERPVGSSQWFDKPSSQSFMKGLNDDG